jgi:phosphonate transport system permease protein
MFSSASAHHPDPAWRGRIIATLIALLLLWPMLVASEFKPWILLDAQSLQATWHFLAGFFPPAHSKEFLFLLLEASWQTIAIATAGLTLALESGRMRPASAAIRQLARWLLVLLRSVPELVWALLLVRIVGLGPTAGVLAIALTYSGMLGKVYAEILESSESYVTESLLKNGSSRLAALCYGALPASASELVSYTTFRWECAIRGSVMMGFVGAGGIGQRMDESMKMLAGAEVSSMLIIFVLLVACADLISTYLRKRLG